MRKGRKKRSSESKVGKLRGWNCRLFWLFHSHAEAKSSYIYKRGLLISHRGQPSTSLVSFNFGGARGKNRDSYQKLNAPFSTRKIFKARENFALMHVSMSEPKNSNPNSSKFPFSSFDRPTRSQVGQSSQSSPVWVGRLDLKRVSRLVKDYEREILTASAGWRKAVISTSSSNFFRASKQEKFSFFNDKWIKNHFHFEIEWRKNH